MKLMVSSVTYELFMKNNPGLSSALLITNKIKKARGGITLVKTKGCKMALWLE
jgi:hypothetical protein